jgi:hypothetical protein
VCKLGEVHSRTGDPLCQPDKLTTLFNGRHASTSVSLDIQ